jgi:hypothetical protein
MGPDAGDGVELPPEKSKRESTVREAGA